jgi:hypothetical protein
VRAREAYDTRRGDATSVKIDNSPARGTRDLLPANVAVRDHVLESITTVYRRFGYQRIETPPPPPAWTGSRQTSP